MVPIYQGIINRYHRVNKEERNWKNFSWEISRWPTRHICTVAALNILLLEIDLL